MRRLHALIVIVFCIHLEQNCVNPHPDVCQEEFYIPAFEGDPQVPKQMAFDGASQVSRKQLPKKLNWIDAQIQDELIPLSDNAAQAFQSRISEICELKITIDQVKLIVTQILEPLETPTYLDILPKTCSALITATVPYLVDDPFCRILTGFQNYKGNDAYLEAALSNHKERLYHLSRVVGQNYDRPNKDGITALLAACHSCNYYELKRILKATTTISHDRRDPLGRTALHLLAQHCHSGRLFRRSPVLSADHQSIATIDETASTTDSQNSDPASNPVEYLLRKAPHFDENIRNHDGDTVLHMACRDLDPCLVNVLLKRETIDITIPDCQGQTALDILLENGKMATSVDDNAKFARCLAAFIIKGAHVNAAERFGPDGNTVLHLMCLLECVAALNKLLESRPKETNLMNKYDQTPFQIAFKKDGNRIGSMTRSFIENGCADVVVQLDRGDTILHLACRDRDLSTVNLLMGYPLAQVNHKNQLSQTPLHIVYMSKVGMVTGPLTAEDIDDDYADRHVLPKTEALIMETLLGNSNTDPNVRDFQGDALIHLACRKSDYETVSTLMKFKRTIVNLMGRHGQTPIQIAFDMENLSKIRGDCLKCEGDSICPNRSILCLLLRNQEVSPVVKSEGTTLLHLACEYSNSAAIRLLLNNKNTAVDALDYSLHTPLKYTTLRDCRDRFRISQIMRQLLESQRINPNEPINDAEDTLLHLACRHGDVEAIRFLLTLPNITMNARNKNGKTPLQLAYAYDQRSEAGLRAIKPYIGELTTAILGGPNPDCNAPLDQSSNTILHLLTESYYSCSLKQQPALRSLIKRIISERMANPNLTNRDGLRPLETVYKNEKLGFLENGSKGLLKIFLDSEDFDPNVPLRDVHGCSLLHVACAESNAPAVKALLKHRSIDIMVPDNYGFIPFKVACDVDRETNGEQNLSAKQIVHELFTAGKNLLNETGMALLLKILEENILSNQSKN